MPGGTGDPVVGVGLDRGYGVVVRLVTGKKLRAEHPFGYFRQVLVPEFLDGQFREIVELGAAGAGAQIVDNALAHESADAGVAIGIAGDGVSDHGIDADKRGAWRDGDLAENAARPAEDMREPSFPAADDRGLVHDPADRKSVV